MPRPRATLLAPAVGIALAGPVVPVLARAEPPATTVASPRSESPAVAQNRGAPSEQQPVAPTSSASEPAESSVSATSAPAPTPLPAASPTTPAEVPTPPSSPSPPAASDTARSTVSPGEAFVHVAVSYRGAWLETRSAVDGGDFVRACAAPCDRKLSVEGLEARVVAPAMTTSNVFRFEAGAGVASLRVDGGSAAARRAGIIALGAGIPVALAGMGLFAQGRVKDQKGLEAAGIVGLAVGGLSLAVSLPLLLKGTTNVKNAKGSLIALAPFVPTL